MWKWMSRPAALGLIAVVKQRFISVYALQKLLGGDPEVKGNMWGQIFKTLDLLELCLESLVPFIQPAGSLRG